jgi:lipopolysaccharide export LptBFGC system permease protein LptF
MNTQTSSTSRNNDRPTTPTWFWIVTGLGLAWNIFGLTAFNEFAKGTKDYWQSTGMTAEQAALYSSLPSWMTAAFALGVVAAVIGCLLLLARNRLAVPVLWASLLGYIALYIGDIIYGVFAALGMPQIVVLSLVVAVAAGLLWMANYAKSRGMLR